MIYMQNHYYRFTLYYEDEDGIDHTILAMTIHIPEMEMQVLLIGREQRRYFMRPV